MKRSTERTYATTGNAFFRPRRPLITYGKKDSCPLPLSAHDFRLDPYTIPADEDDQAGEHGARDPQEALADTSASLEATANEGVGSGPSDDSGPPHHAGDASGVKSLIEPKSAPSIPPRERDGSPAPKKVKGVVRRKARRAPPRTARRLPVNELVLVPSPADDEDHATLRSRPPGARTQRPLGDQTNPPHALDVSPIESEDDGHREQLPKQQPLSALHKRLRSGKSRYKSVADLRRRRAEQLSAGRTSSNPRPGDGFDDQELSISPLARKAARQRHVRQDPFLLSFGALQLQSGPLPDVKFETTSSTAVSPPQKLEAESSSCRSPDAVRDFVKSRGQVSFTAQAREQAILAQLSSISAPPLPRPESDESDGEDEEDQEADLDEEMIADGFRAVADDEIYEADTETEQDPHDVPKESREGNSINTTGVAIDEAETSAASEGISYDFRRPGLGQPPRRRRIRQDSLVEVQDNIIDVPDYDDNVIPSFQPTMPQSQHPIPAHQQVPEAEAPPRPSLKRPRSILKNASQAMYDDNTKPEYTESNTRRNSTVELSESRYFTDAADMLRRNDPSKHQIVPRRRSRYFDEEVEMLDSGGIVAETSPSPEPEEMLDYTTTSNLSVLRRQSEVEWMSSQSLPSVAKDLGALTRSVSRGHGTLSQSARRRPSLPFQSPSKII